MRLANGSVKRDQKFKLELIDGISDREVSASDEGVAEEGVSIYHNGGFHGSLQGDRTLKKQANAGISNCFAFQEPIGAVMAIASSYSEFTAPHGRLKPTFRHT